MEPNENDNCVPKRLGSFRGTLDHPSTREIESANGRLYDMPRPPPTGEDSSENDRLKEGLVGQFKADSYEPPSPRLTPRRSTAKELPVSRGASLATDEEKLAPLGFEPEGQAVSSPTFHERLGTCFTDMLSNCEGSYVFYQYLRRINRDILLDFCRTCDDFRGMVPTSPQTRSTAKAIFQKYIFSGETCELLGIKESTRTKIAEHISDQPTDPLLFEQACSEVMMNLKSTYYESFLSSSFYKEFPETHCESPKIINEMVAPYSGRFQGGYLPTLPEEKVLGFGEEIEEFEYDQQCKNAKGLSGLTYSTNPTSDEKNARKLLHNPVKDISSPYYYPTAPLASITESAESQSMSSDALTDDTLSMTTDTSDGHSRHSGGRRHSRRSRNTANNPMSRFPFVPRTHRMPKEARNPLSPEEFVRILNQKLEKVVIERQLQEREAINLSHSIDVESASSGHSKKSILQEAIENKERRDKIPLSTMAMMSPLPVQDDTTSISTSNHSSSKSTSANATAGSGAVNSSSSDSTHKRSRSRHASKSSRHESDKPCEQAPHLHRESSKPHKDINIPADDNIPFLTINHHRILKWMEMGEEELQKQKTTKARHQSKSRQSSSSSRTGESYSGQFQPNQPIAQDPMMPLLPQPEATTVLGEVRRRLMETKENDRRSKHNQKHRSRGSVDNTSDSMSSFQDKSSSADCSSCAQSLLSYDLKPHQSCEASSTFSSIPSSASNINNDTKSRSDSGIGTGLRKKEKHNSTTIIYWLWAEPIAYRTSLPGKNVTLGQFKTLIMRKGEFRYFFKTKTDEEDRDCEVVYEEVRVDESKLPLYEGKIVGKVEKVDS